MTEYNASDRKQIRAAEKDAAIADRSRGEVIVSLMSTEPGRRYVWDKLAYAGIFATTFSTDPIQMAFNEGQRNQGLLFLNDVIEYCPDMYILAMREANGRRTSTSPRSAGERPDSEDADGGDSGSAGEAA